jgi:hypothetical protein
MRISIIIPPSGENASPLPLRGELAAHILFWHFLIQNNFLGADIPDRLMQHVSLVEFRAGRDIRRFPGFGGTRVV